MAKRQVEVFTAGCPVCEPAVQLVSELACPDCEVTVHDLRDRAEASTGEASPAQRAAQYGIKVVPAVVVNGSLVSCCQASGPNRGELSQAGIGQRL
jgi:predicted DsbA family dithiol-disulfide isomerase